MIFSCSNITKSFDAEVILNEVTFGIEEKEKVAIIGVNGAGKSTLFKIITGELSADSGEVTIPKDVKVGYFSQNLEISSDKSIYAELLTVFDPIIKLEAELRDIEAQMASLEGEELALIMKRYSALSAEFERKNGYEYQSRLRGVIKGLGFSNEEFDQPINQLSGGQKTRVALGKLLLSSPDILLLDEPTNHLDIDSINWLEDFLRAYQGSVIIISHDRYFLDKIVTKVMEIENKKLTIYNGNYSYYSAKKEKDREVQLKHYLNQQKEIAKQQEAIQKLRSFNREKSIKRAESKEKQLQKMELTDKPDNLPDSMKLTLKPKFESGNDVLSIKELAKAFDDAPLFKNVSFEIKKGEKVALIGPNGVGKTTLFKIILDRVKADSGSVKVGANVSIGYYDQEHATLDTSKTIFDEISDTYPNLTILEIRNVLASFVFTGDDVFKPISALSGGEKGRVALAKIMLSSANFLILDEPTNHLDINSKEILEAALRNYEGTCLYISHDRYFINNTAQKIIELSPEGATQYLGNYDYYIEKTRITEDMEAENTVSVKAETATKLDWKKQKEEQAEIRKKEAKIKKTEDEIALLEEKIEELDAELAKEEVYTNAELAKQHFDEKSAAEEKLNLLYEQWEELNS